MSKKSKYCFSLFRATGIAMAMLLTCYATMLQAQNTDSLKIALRERAFDDTTRVNLMAKIAEATKDVMPDSSISIAMEGIKLADKLNFEKGKLNCILILARAHYSKGEYAAALEYYTQVRVAAEKKNLPVHLSQALFGLGITYNMQDKNKLSMEYLTNAMKVSEKANDYNGIAKATLRMGDECYEDHKYEEALKNYLIALRNFEKQGNTVKEAATCAGISILYSATNDKKNTILYAERSLSLIDRNALPIDRVGIYSDLGSAYSGMKEHEKAIELLKRGYKIADSINVLYYKNALLFNIATSEFMEGDLDAANGSYDQLLHDNANSYDSNFISMVVKGKADILFEQHKYKEGLKYAQIAYDYQLKRGQIIPLSKTAQSMAKAYAALNDYKNALKYHTIYSDYKDSAVKAGNTESIQQLQYEYDLEKKQAQIELLNKSKLIDKEKAGRQKDLLIGSLIGLGAFLIIIILLVGNRQGVQRSRKLLFKQKEEIQEQAARLQVLNEFKDNTFSVLSHDLRGPVAAFAMTMSMMEKRYMTIEEFNEMKPELNSKLTSVSALLDNLLQWSENYMKGNAAQPERVRLKDIARQNIDLVSNTASVKQITITNKIPANTKAWCDEGQIDIVVRNLITNALKFTETGGTVIISTAEEGDMIRVSVADNGVGMTDEQLSRLFVAAADNHTYGTHGERGTGLGLLLCAEFVKANNGTITAESQEGKGTTFSFTLPKNAPAA